MSPLATLSDLFFPDVQLYDVSNPGGTELLAGATRVDLNTDLADLSLKGGRHPLPAIQSFAQTLQRLGIHPESRVILYDRQGGANAAARFWWMLKAVGHQQVQVLNGGFQMAKAGGYDCTHEALLRDSASTPYPVTKWLWPTAQLPEIEKLSDHPDTTLIDVRDPDRYAGKVEPLDPVAGHIPGAINLPFRDNLDTSGHFLTPEQLRRQFSPLLGQKLVVHCGSGVTACHTILAMHYAGLPLPKLYVGSWSEWCTTGH